MNLSDLKQATTAQEWISAGVSLLPVLPNSKRPAIQWKWLQIKIADPQQVEFWHSYRNWSMGAVCGEVSGGLEVLDFDDRADEIFPLWKQLVEPIFDKLDLPVVRTPSGVHVYFRADEINGNSVLAKESLTSVLIETRGEGD